MCGDGALVAARRWVRIIATFVGYPITGYGLLVTS